MSRVGGIISKSGSVIKQLQQSIGTKIRIEDAPTGRRSAGEDVRVDPGMERRRDTETKIRFLTDNLPVCASHTEEIVELAHESFYIGLVLLGSLIMHSDCPSVNKRRVSESRSTESVEPNTLRRAIEVIPQKTLPRPNDLLPEENFFRTMEIIPKETFHRPIAEIDCFATRVDPLSLKSEHEVVFKIIYLNIRVVTPGSMPKSSSAVTGSCSSKPFTNKSISIRLDESNYLLWRQQVLFSIDSLALGSHIDGTIAPPSQYVVVNGVRSLNPDFVAFKQEDSALCSWLLSSISGTILPSLVNCRTAIEIWDKVQHKFSVFSTTKIMHLHCSLKNLRKRDQSMRDYLAQIQSICDNLAACGNPLIETMHISTILSGLPSEYESVVAVITSSQQSYKLDGVCSVLLDTEARQQETHSIPVNFAQGSFGFGNGFSHNTYSSQGSGYSFLGPFSNSWNEFGSTGFVGQVSSSVVSPGGVPNGQQSYVGQPRFSQDSSFRSFRPNLSNPANSSGFQGGRSSFYRGRGGRVYGGRSRPQC
ncbi:hypothetical protein GQ457_18G015380 [Hibiscus cannabinus]